MTPIIKKKIISKVLTLVFLLICLLFNNVGVYGFDLIQITNTPADECDHSLASRGKSIYLVWEADAQIFFSIVKRITINMIYMHIFRITHNSTMN